MEISEFLTAFAEQFEETDVSKITPDCFFHELDEWSSITNMSIIAMIRIKYQKEISGKEIRNCDTIEELFQLINLK